MQRFLLGRSFSIFRFDFRRLAFMVFDTSLWLSRYSGNSAKFRLGLQDDFDIEEDMQAKGRVIKLNKSISNDRRMITAIKSLV